MKILDKPNYTIDELINNMVHAKVDQGDDFGGKLSGDNYVLQAQMKIGEDDITVIANYPKKRFNQGLRIAWNPYFAFCQTDDENTFYFNNSDSKKLYKEMKKNYDCMS